MYNASKLSIKPIAGVRRVNLRCQLYVKIDPKSRRVRYCSTCKSYMYIYARKNLQSSTNVKNQAPFASCNASCFHMVSAGCDSNRYELYAMSGCPL